jgi:hypothetical protein
MVGQLIPARWQAFRQASAGCARNSAGVNEYTATNHINLLANSEFTHLGLWVGTTLGAYFYSHSNKHSYTHEHRNTDEHTNTHSNTYAFTSTTTSYDTTKVWDCTNIERP